MKCPACCKGLKLICQGQRGEYICINEKCPANVELRRKFDALAAYCEFYGSQKEINKQWP